MGSTGFNDVQSSRGSSASRNPSPSRLKPSTARKMAMPGKIDIHGAWLTKSFAVFSIDPHDGAGGNCPSPRNDRLASAGIAKGTGGIACTVDAGTPVG